MFTRFYRQPTRIPCDAPALPHLQCRRLIDYASRRDFDDDDVERRNDSAISFTLIIIES